GRDNAADFPANSAAAARFAGLGDIIKQLDAAKAAQQNSGVAAREVVLDALRLDIQNIARTARAIAQDSHGFADRFKLPDNPSQTALLTTADAFLDELNQPGVAARFVTHELPPDFVQHFAADRTAVSAAQSNVESNRGTSVASTAAIGAAIQGGMK